MQWEGNGRWVGGSCVGVLFSLPELSHLRREQLHPKGPWRCQHPLEAHSSYYTCPWLGPAVSASGFQRTPHPSPPPLPPPSFRLRAPDQAPPLVSSHPWFPATQALSGLLPLKPHNLARPHVSDLPLPHLPERPQPAGSICPGCGASSPGGEGAGPGPQPWGLTIGEGLAFPGGS